jgi:hypothetical protein
LKSPYAGQTLTQPLRGCVTGVAAEGFFLQDPAGDGKRATSDGIYVYRYSSWRNPRELKPGDLVEIARYKVMEFYGQTEIAGLSNDKNETYRVVGKCPLPPPVRIAALMDPKADLSDDYERVEGQRVIIDLDASVVGPTQRFESRFPAGDPEMTVAAKGSPYFGQRIPADGLPINRGTLALSGGLNADLPTANTFDTVTASGLTGILAYQFGRYVLLVDNPAALQVKAESAAAPVEPAAGPDEWTLCSFNAENLFDAVNDKDGDMGDWAPADTEAYRQQIARRARMIREGLGNCTVIGLQEVEGKDAVWSDLARGLGPTYRFDYWESADARDITAGLIYDTRRIEVLKSRAAPACGPEDYKVDPRAARGPRAPDYSCPAGAYPLFDRAPYVADLLARNESGDRRSEARVVVVHLKSKRGDEEENAERRVEQARYVASLLDAPAAVAVGDFNDTLGSEPLRQFPDLTNLYDRYVAPAERYTYIYNGRAQAVDHILMTPEMERFLVAGGPAHVNADYGEPLPGEDGRVSDHDPVVARFVFRPTGLRVALLGAAWGAALGGYHHLSRLK